MAFERPFLGPNATAFATLKLGIIHGKIFGLFEQKTPADIVSGKARFIGTQAGPLAAGFLMAIPSLMVFPSPVPGPAARRWVNIVLDPVFTVIIIATMPGSWMFYELLEVIEVYLTLSIVWHAFGWPQTEAPAPS